MDRGLIDDEDSEGGEEPDLIANHPVGDIVDRQFRDVADLHIDVINNKEVQNNCVMNQKHLLNSWALTSRIFRILSQSEQSKEL